MEAVPYCGHAPIPSEIAARWNTDPLLIGVLACALAIAWALPDPRRRMAWIAGCAVLAIVFVSPLCALGSALFAARSLHHLLLAAVAAPLLAVALPTPQRSHGAAALLASTGVLWLWHWPPLYTLAYENHAVYWAMQIALLASFAWFWRAVLAATDAPLAAILLIGAGAGQMGLLGAVLTFTPRPLYDVHGLASLAWGLDPLSDQQLGGLLMWVPAFFVYGLFAILVARRGIAGASLT